MLLLVDDVLGELELKEDPYVVVDWEIGPREVRTVARPRALADGQLDDTRFLGARAVTVSVRLNEKAQCPEGLTTQALYDRLMPYLSARRRPRLRWELPGSPGVVRELTVRGEGAPIVVQQARHPFIMCQFVAPEGEITSVDEQTVTIAPSEDTEAGRSYDLAYPRAYPASLGLGARLVTNGGNEQAHWKAVIYGTCTDPVLEVNGHTIAMTLSLVAGQYLTIDTRERTILFGGDPTEPRAHLSNYTDWAWEELLLEGGDNRVRFSAATLGTGGSARMTFRDTWC